MLKKALIGLALFYSSLANAGLIFTLSEVGGGSSNINITGSGSFIATANGTIDDSDIGDPNGQLSIDYVTSDYNAEKLITSGNLTIFNLTRGTSMLIDRVYLDSDGGVGGNDDFRVVELNSSLDIFIGDIIFTSGAGVIQGLFADPVTNDILHAGADTGDINAWNNDNSFRLIVAQPSVVPEPNIFAVLSLGILFFAARRFTKL